MVRKSLGINVSCRISRLAGSLVTQRGGGGGFDGHRNRTVIVVTG
jgi:hypothetical protein